MAYPHEFRELALSNGRVLKRGDGLPLVMGILNVTPDSFSDGGRFLDPGAALDQAQRLEAEGADIIDVGAESSRPGAKPIGEDEEWRRLEPVLNRLAHTLKAAVSVDTVRASTASRALSLGAVIINDISGGTADPKMLSVCAGQDTALCLMHMQGTPRTMQKAPTYSDVVTEVRGWLAGRVDAATKAGLPAGRLMVDPGFGFGKAPADNAALVRSLAGLRGLGLVMLGLSRKSSLAHWSGTKDSLRLPESLAGAVMGAMNGADLLRVHDVEPTIRALRAAREMV